MNSQAWLLGSFIPDYQFAPRLKIFCWLCAFKLTCCENKLKWQIFSWHLTSVWTMKTDVGCLYEVWLVEFYICKGWLLSIKYYKRYLFEPTRFFFFTNQPTSPTGTNAPVNCHVYFELKYLSFLPQTKQCFIVTKQTLIEIFSETCYTSGIFKRLLWTLRYIFCCIVTVGWHEIRM